MYTYFEIYIYTPLGYMNSYMYICIYVYGGRVTDSGLLNTDTSTLNGRGAPVCFVCVSVGGRENVRVYVFFVCLCVHANVRVT